MGYLWAFMLKSTIHLTTWRGRRILVIYHVKLLATDSILKNDPDKKFDELRFAVDNDGTNIIIIINKGEIAMMMK